MRDNDLSVSPPRITRRRLLALGAGAGALGLGWPRSAPAAVRVEITSGDVQPMPIALPDFIGGAPADSEAARGVTQVITNDLKRSGLFAPIDPAAYIERIVNSPASRTGAPSTPRPFSPAGSRASPTGGSRPSSVCGTFLRASSSRGSNISPRRTWGAASPTSSPTRFMNA
jgi:hypothetical protein